MRKLVLSVAVTALSISVLAQPRAIGFRLGGNQELTYQQYAGGDNMFVQIDLGSFYFQGIQATATYNWLFGGNNALSTYGGFGLGAGFNFRDNAWYIRAFDDPETTKFTTEYTCVRRYFFMGIGGQIGLEYKFGTAPVALSLDYRPMIGFDIGKKGLKANGNDAIPYPNEANKLKFAFHAPGIWAFGLGLKYIF